MREVSAILESKESDNVSQPEDILDLIAKELFSWNYILWRKPGQRNQIETRQDDYQEIASHLEDLRTMCDPKERKTLIARYTECTKFLGRVCEVVSAREDALDKLMIFHKGVQDLKEELDQIQTELKTAVITSDQLSKWQQESQDLKMKLKECSESGVGLDQVLQQAQLTALDSVETKQRTTVKGYLNRLEAKVDQILSEIAIKQEHFDEVDNIWRNFLDRKERLVKAVDEIEEKASADIHLERVQQDDLQELSKKNEKLREELDSKQYELSGLQSKGKQLLDADSSQTETVKDHLKLVDMSWEDAESAIEDTDEHLQKLTSHLKDYEFIRGKNSKILKNAESMAEAAEAPRHFTMDEVKRHLGKLESLKDELDEQQAGMDEMKKKGKLLSAAIKKIIVCDTAYVHKELEDIIDRYLDVQDKVEETIESLTKQLSLWRELSGADDDMEEWMNTSISDLNASISSLDDSSALKEKLAAVQGEIDMHKSLFEALQSKVTEMHQTRKRLSVGEMDELAQVNDNMKMKLDKALAVFKQAQLKLDDFTTQRSMLSNYVDELNDWLQHKQNSLRNLLRDKRPENLNKARDIHDAISEQQDNVESAKEHLNSLCRKYQTTELEKVQEKVGTLLTTNEEAYKLSVSVVEDLENHLDEEFNSAVKSFYAFYRAGKEVLADCSDTSADIPVLEGRVQKLQSYAAKVDDGQTKLNAAVEAGNHCIEHLPRSIESVKTQITSMKEDWLKFLDQLEEVKVQLQSSLSGLRSLEENRKDLASWLKDVEKQMRDEDDLDSNLEEKLKRKETIQAINKDLSSKSKQVETLLQQAYELVEGDSSQSAGARKAHQLITSYHGICKKAKERLRDCEQIVRDHEQYDESFHTAQEWIDSATTRLDTCLMMIAMTKSSDDMETGLHAAQETVQELSLEKQQGEVNLNVALGKGERAMAKTAMAGKDIMKKDLYDLKNSHDEFIEKLSDCKAKLDQKMIDWMQYSQARSELESWLSENEAVLSGSLAPAVDLKDKVAQYEKYKLLLQDVESHKETVDVLNEKALDLDQDEIKGMLDQYDHVLSLAKERFQHLKSCVEVHEGYYEAVQDVCGWINSAKEELNRWSDTAGDKETLQKKLTKVLELKASRGHGRQKLDTATEIGELVIANTAEEGQGVIETEIASLKEEWRAWDRGMTESEIVLQSKLTQLSKYEESYSVEKSALQKSLAEFQEKLAEIQSKLPQEGTEEITKPANAFKTKKLCQSLLKDLDELQEKVDGLKARLNNLCRSYQSPEIDQLSKQVTTSLQQYDNMKMKLTKLRSKCERNLLEAFHTSAREFDQWLKAKKELILKYGDVSGDRESAKKKLKQIQGLLQSIDEGKAKLNSLITLGEELPSILRPESGENVRHQTRQYKEAWRNFLAIMQEKEQSLQSYIEQLADFATSVAELTKWLHDVQERFEGETGFRATIGLKKSQFNSLQSIAEDVTEPNYKFERLKRKAHKLGSSPELSQLNSLTAQYHTISKQVQDALKSSEQNLLDHQLYQTAFTEAQEWNNDFNHRLETYSNLTGGKEMLEQRLHKLETLLGGKQEGEVKINITRGHSEKILPTTALKGQPAIRSQVMELVQSWQENITKAEDIREQLRKCIVAWEKYEEAVKFAQTWLQNTDVTVKAEKIVHGGQTMTPEALFSDLEKCRALYRDIKSKVGMIDNVQQCATKIASLTGDVSGTRVDIAEIREHYQELQNAAQALLDEAETLAESAKTYHQALHVFTDWFSGKSVELFRLSDTSCGKEMLLENIKALEALQKEIPEGDEKLKQAVSAGKRSSPDKSINLQLQTLKEEWSEYRKKLDEALTTAKTLVQETAKYGKICSEFSDWITAMEQCPDADIELTSSLSENRELLERYKAYSNEISANQSKLDKLNRAAQQLVGACGSTDGNVSMQVTQMMSRYQTLIIRTKDKLRKYQDTIQLQSDFDNEAEEFDKWLQTTDERFAMYTLPENIDAENAQDCSDKLDELLAEFESHKNLLSSISDKNSKLCQLLDPKHTEEFRHQTAAQHEDYQELLSRIQTERGNLRRTLRYYEDYQDSVNSFKEWMADMQRKINAKLEIKYELFEKKAQLARFMNYRDEILKHEEILQAVILKARRLPDNIRESREVEHLNEEYQRLAKQSKQRVDDLKSGVKVHQDYFDGLQAAEKWLLSKSSQITAASAQDFPSELDISQESAVKFESQLKEFQGILEELNNFRTEIQSLSSLSKKLLNEYEDKEPLEGQVKAQLEKLQGAYVLVHEAATQLVDRLKGIVHQQQDFNVKLQQIRSWLTEKEAAVKVCMIHKPTSLQESQRIVKDLAFTAIELEEIQEFIQENLLTHPEKMEPMNQQLAEFQNELDAKMQLANDVATDWLAVTEAQAELQDWLTETEVIMERLGDLSSETVSEVVLRNLPNCKELREDIENKNNLLKQLEDKYRALLGPDAPMDPGFLDVYTQWEHLLNVAKKLCDAQEENQEANKDFSSYLRYVEGVVKNFKTEIDKLVQYVDDNTETKLEKAKNIVERMSNLRGILDILNEKMQIITPRMTSHDAESAEDDYRSVSQRWVDCEQKAQSRYQMLLNTVNELKEYRKQLEQTKLWLTEQKMKFQEPVPMTISIEELNAARQKHNMLCVEMVHKKEEFDELSSSHQTLPLNLSQQERESLQCEVEELQKYFKEVQKIANEKTNDLNLAIGKRKDLWATAQQAIAWLDHLRESLRSHHFPPLSPDAAAKLIQDHRVLYREIMRHKKTVDDVTAAGLQMIYEGKPEGVSTRGKLSGLEDNYKEVEDLWKKKMEFLQNLLAERELFQADCDRCHRWLKEGDIVTFPEVNLAAPLSDLENHIGKYRQISAESGIYQDLVQKIQGKARIMRPDLSEADQDILDVKLKSIEDQFNLVCAAAVDKEERLKEMMAARKEYTGELGSFEDYLSKGQALLQELDDMPTGYTSTRAQELLEKAKMTQETLAQRKPRLDSIEKMRDSLKNSGQPWQPEELLKATAIFHRLMQQCSQRIERFAGMVRDRESFEMRSRRLADELEEYERALSVGSASRAEHKLSECQQTAAELTSAQIELRSISGVAEQISGDMAPLDKAVIREKVDKLRDMLHGLQSEIGDKQRDLERRLMSRRDFQGELEYGIVWLEEMQAAIECDKPLKLDTQSVQEEMKKLQLIQEEVQSRLRMLIGLGELEVDKYQEEGEEPPRSVNQKLTQVHELKGSLTTAILAKQVRLEDAYASRQKYASCLSKVQAQLGSASAELQLLSGDNSPRKARSLLEEHQASDVIHQYQALFTTEDEVLHNIEELSLVAKDLEQSPALSKTARRALTDSVDSARGRADNLLDMAHEIKDGLERSAISWEGFDEELEKVQGKVTQAESQLSAVDCTMPDTVHSARVKVENLKPVLFNISQLDHEVQALQKVSESISAGSFTGRMSVNRCISAVKARIERLQTRSREVERLFEKHLRDWEQYHRQVSETKSILERIENRMPVKPIERCTALDLETQKSLLSSLSKDLLSTSRRMSTIQESSQNISKNIESHHLRDLDREVGDVETRLQSLTEEANEKTSEVKKEMTYRETIQAELHDFLQWLKEAKVSTEHSMDLTPSPAQVQDKIDSLKQLKEHLATKWEYFESSTDNLQKKYLEKLTLLPPEISTLMAKIKVAFDELEDEIKAREKDLESAKILREEYQKELLDISTLLGDAEMKLTTEVKDYGMAEIEHRVLKSDLDKCQVRLVSLDAMAVEIAEQTTYESSRISINAAISALNEQYARVVDLANARSRKFSSAVNYHTEVEETHAFLRKWRSKAENILAGPLTMKDLSDARTQLKENKALRKELKQLRKEIDRMRERIPDVGAGVETPGPDEESFGSSSTGVGTLPSSSFFTRKIDQMAAECRDLEDKIRQREDTLSSAISTALEMDEETKAISDGVEGIRRRYPNQHLDLEPRDQLNAKKRLLGQLEMWKNKLKNVKNEHPFLCSPFPTPRTDSSDPLVPKLELEQLHETPAIKLAQKTGQVIDDLELSLTSDIYALESLLKDSEPYEDEIERVSALLSDARHRLQNFLLSDGDLDEHKKLLEEVKGYEEELKRLKNQKSNLESASMSSINPPIHHEEVDAEVKVASEMQEPVLETVDAVHIENQHFSPDSGHPPKSVSPARSQNISQLSKFLSREFGSSCSGSVSSGSVSSLVDTDVLSPVSAEKSRLEEEISPHPLPIDASSPYYGGQESYKTLEEPDSAEGDALSHRVQELLFSSIPRDNAQSLIQEITRTLDEYQDRLETVQTARSLEGQFEDNQNLLDDLNHLQSKLDSVERWTGSLAHDFAGKDAMSTTVAVLYDRWDTMRMQATSKQSVIEIKMLEDEQYCRMVEAYKAELLQVTEWVEDAKKLQESMKTVAESPNPPSAGTLNEDLAFLKKHIQDCEKTAADVERKLRLISELCEMRKPKPGKGDNPSDSNALQPMSARSQRSSAYGAVASTTTPPPSASTDKTLSLSRGERENEKLLERLDSLRDELESLQKEVKEKGKEFKDALEAKQEQIVEKYQKEVGKMQEWLMEAKMLDLEKSTDKDFRKFRHELQQHQEVLDEVTALGRMLGVSQSPESAENKKRNWDDLLKYLQQKAKFTPKILKNIPQGTAFQRRVSNGLECTNGQAAVDAIKGKLQDLQDCWNHMKGQPLHNQEALEKLQRQTQVALEAVSNWMDGAECRLSRIGSFEVEQQLKDALKSETESVQGQMGQLRNVNDNISSSVDDPDFADSLKSALQSLSERLRSLNDEASQRQLDFAENFMERQDLETDLVFLSNKIADLYDDICMLHIDDVMEYPNADSKIQEFKESADYCKEKLERAVEDADELELPAWSATVSELQEVKRNYSEMRAALDDQIQTLGEMNAEETQFAQMLLDYSEALIMGQQKLKLPRVIMRDATELKIYIEKFKDFFSGLRNHHTLCSETAGRLHRTVLKLHEQTFAELKAKHSTLENRSFPKQQQLEKIAKIWESLEDKLSGHMIRVSRLEKEVEEVKPNEENVHSVSDCIDRLQSIQQNICDLDAELQKSLDDADRIYEAVKCDELKSKLNELVKRIIFLKSNVEQELERLQSLQEILPKFTELSTNVTEWFVENYQRPVSIVAEVETFDPEEEEMRQKCEEFEKVIHEFQNIKMSAEELTELAKKLELVKKENTNGIRETVNGIEENVEKMNDSLPELSERLNKAQIDLMSVTQSAEEIMKWIRETNLKLDKMKRQSRSLTGSQHVKDQLAMYKAYQMEVKMKEATINFINKSSANASLLSGRNSEVDHADKVGQMNMDWEVLKARIENCVSQLEPELVKWLEHEKAIEKMQHWLDGYLEMFQQYSKPGSKSQIQRLLLEIQDLEPKLKKKYSDIRKLEKEYKELVTAKDEKFRAESPEPGLGSSNLAKLNQSWALLEHKLNQERKNLKKALDQWEKFNSAETITSKELDTAEHTLLQSSVSCPSMDSVVAQLSKLEGLQLDLERHSFQQQMLQIESSCLISMSDSSAAEDVRKKVNSQDTRWNDLSSTVEDLILKHRKSLEIWQQYENQYQQIENRLLSVKSQSDDILSPESMLENPQQCELKAEELVHVCSELEASLPELFAFSEKLKETSSTSSLQIDARSSRLEQAIGDTAHQLQNILQQVRKEKSKINDFKQKLKFIETWLNEAEAVLKQDDTSIDENFLQSRMEELKIQLHAFKTYSSSLDDLNSLGYQLPLQESHVRKLQDVNNRWTEISRKTAERFQRLQSLHLQHLNFMEKCESWMLFITQMESSLTSDLSPTYKGLLDQSRTMELFTVEMISRQIILHAILSDGERLLESGSDEERVEFKRKLDELSSQWQLVMMRMQQRKFAIDEGIRLWRSYDQSKRHFKNWMEATEGTIKDLECEKKIRFTVQGVKSDLEKLEALERSASANEEKCSSTLQAGKDVMHVTRDAGVADLKRELSSLHNEWLAINKIIQKKKRDLQDLLTRWNSCESKIAEMSGWLRNTKQVLATSDLCDHNEIHSALIKCRDREIMFDMTGDKLRSLEVNVEEFKSEISRADVALLRQRVELLRRQWEELRDQTKQQRSQIEARLSEWDEFDDKYHELCEWLNEMESKISQAVDLPLEDVMDHMEKQYQEEIAGAEDQKAELRDLGEKLIGERKEGRSQDVRHKLDKLDDRWKNLENTNKSRSKKLKETLRAVSQLEFSMNDLRSWLQDIEDGLAKPIVHQNCDDRDVVERLTEQQALQQDIEKHSSGVASVLNLCEVLLHDADACSNETEKKSIEQATESLDRRWRNICSLSMERKLKIEETQRLWKKFIEDYSRFSDWLRSAERVVTYPNTYMVCHKVAKEELKKFESFQRQVHESLTQLELINKQYRKLARENRTDATNKLRTMIHDGNSRWDGISHRVTSILRRLKHAINRREDFETRREALVVWLTETDLRLTNVEHFSRFGNHEKLKELKNFQVAIEEHIPQIIDLHTRGQYVLEKSEELDSVIIEEELVELQRYCREVVSRLDKYHRKLLRIMNEPPPLDSSLFEDTELAKMSWWERYIAETGSSRTSSPSGENERHSTTPRNPKKLHESISSHSGRASPESLEWDLYDISQSELETKDTGVLSDDGSIPEISPLEMDGDDIPLLHVSRDSNPTTPRQDATNASRRGHDTSHPDSSTPIKKLRTSKDEASQQKAQFFNDLAATLAWLDATDQVTDQEMNKSRPKYDKSVEELQREVNELKSLQKSIEQRKAIVLSINLVASSHTDSIDITRKLNKMNSNWEALQQKSTEWNKSLKESVKESQDFQTALETITEWVDEQNHRRDDLAMMQRRESPDSSPTSKLQALKKDQRALEKMKIDTSDAISKATSMQDICTHLSKPTSDPVHHVEGVRQVSEKVRTTNGRLKTLLDAVRSDLMDMERRIKAARRKVKEERSSDSGAESGDSSLTSGTPLRLRMLQRKVETSELHSSGKRNTEATGNMAASADDNTKHLSDVTQESYSSIEDVTPDSLHARQRREVKYKRQDNNLSRKTIIIEERSGIDVSVLAKRAESRPVAAILPLSDNKSAPLCRRVLLAALPFYIFFLLVLLLLWLLQTYSDDGFGCLRQNNYAYSFAPMLTYTNGPPPV